MGLKGAPATMTRKKETRTKRKTPEVFIFKNL
jgi:hypothetical protein